MLQIQTSSATNIRMKKSLAESSQLMLMSTANHWQKNQSAHQHWSQVVWTNLDVFCFLIMKKIKATFFCYTPVCVFRVDSGCVCAAPGLYPSNQVCCPTAMSPERVAAAPGSWMTYSPTARSLVMSHKHSRVLSFLSILWQKYILPTFYNINMQTKVWVIIKHWYSTTLVYFLRSHL